MDIANTSLIVLAEAQSDGQTSSTDQRHFGVYCWQSTKLFENLLLQQQYKIDTKSHTREYQSPENLSGHRQLF